MVDKIDESVANLIELAGEITIAWLRNPNVKPAPQDAPGFLKDMHSAIAELSSEKPSEPEEVTYQPKVSPRSSVKPDHLVSLIDGKKYKTLKRHLSQHGLTPADYRARYGLKADYPMVAADYANERREIAKKLGLGRKPAASQSAADGSAPTPEPAKDAAKPKRKAATPKTVIAQGEATSLQVAADRVKTPAKSSTTPRKSTAKKVSDAAPSEVGQAQVVVPVSKSKASSGKASVKADVAAVKPDKAAKVKAPAKAKPAAKKAQPKSKTAEVVAAASEPVT